LKLIVKVRKVAMKKIAKNAIRKVCLLVGRKSLYRAGRFLMYAARGDIDNDPRTNGESAVMTAALSSAASPATVFDVGANVGDWTATLLKISGTLQVLTSVHAFEPCRGTFDRLSQRLSRTSNVILNNEACSRRVGTAVLHVHESGAGTNSLADPIDARETVSEQVHLTTIDLYCEANRIERVDLLKIDAEGHDFEVIAGASEMLSRQAIRIVQFEYNQRWIGCRNYLQDVFAFFTPKGYMIGKLVGKHIECFPYWQWEMETWAEGNYVAYTQRDSQCLRSSKPEWLSFSAD
jgi:FkbM family methyltransferase